MIWILVLMLPILVLAGVVVAYVAYPHRGEEMPHAPWLGQALRRTVDALPTLSNTSSRERERAERQRVGSSGSREGTSRH